MTTTDRLFALEAFGIKLGLDNMRALVEALGHPERACPSIHIAGTNGKGSVAAMTERALRAAGYRTGLYTSPHLDRIEERVAIDGSPASARDFDDTAGAVLDVVDGLIASGRLPGSPTFFEVTTAIAFEVFRRAGVTAAVIEVGLGGRFDATNVIQPAVTAITSIAFDHERHLGATLAAIASEKAGIAKPGVPLVVGVVPDEARAVIEAAADAIGAPIVDAAHLPGFEMEAGHAVFTPPGPAAYPQVRLALAGRHQVANAVTAVRTIEAAGAAGLTTSVDAVVTGLTHARWPGRLEWLRLVTGARVLIDAAHNPAGAAALASYLHDAAVAPMPIVLAAMQDKDIPGMVRPLVPAASRFIVTTVPTPRALSADALAAQVTAVAPHTPVTAVADADAAIDAAVHTANAVAAAGSIYFIGPLRARLLAAGATAV